MAEVNVRGEPLQPCGSDPVTGFYRTGDAVQLARPAIVVQAIGDVRILLHLDQRQPGADRVDGVRRQVDEIARPDLVTWTQAREAQSPFSTLPLSTGSYDLSELANVPRPGAEVAHTAMGDAMWVRAWWDAVKGVTA